MNAIHPLSETTDTVTLARADYIALLDALEDAEDLAAVREVDARVSRGESEFLPFEFAERLIAGESPVRVWREHRGMTAKALAAQAAVSPTYLSEIEAGKKPGSLDAMAKIARALGMSLDDLVHTAPPLRD